MSKRMGAPVGPRRNAPNYVAPNNIIVGKCSADTNPDAWFPDIIGKGAPSRRKLLPIAMEAKRAIDICNACNVKQQCLAIGMEDVNLSYGIWGGTLPNERMEASGKTFAKYSDEGRNMRTMQALEPYFKEAGIRKDD